MDNIFNTDKNKCVKCGDWVCPTCHGSREILVDWDPSCATTPYDCPIYDKCPDCDGSNVCKKCQSKEKERGKLLENNQGGK